MKFDPEEASIVIKDFMKTYLDNSNCKGVVIGLSGGVDSAVTALLCKEVLGKTNTKCVFLPDDTTPKLDIKHTKYFVDKFDLLCKKRDITNIVKNGNLHVCILVMAKL